MAEIDQYEIEQLADAQEPPVWMTGDDEQGLSVEQWIGQLEVITAGECLVKPKPREWIVDQVFAKASTSIIYAEPGVGKSWSLMDLATVITNHEGEWLRRTTINGTCLYLDFEMGSDEIRERQYMVNRGHGVETDIPLYFIPIPEGLNLHTDRKQGIERLCGLVKHYSAAVLFIDTLLDIADGADDNLAKDMSPLIKALKTVAEQTGVTIISTLHPNKMKDYRGSTALKGKPDNLIKVVLKDETLTFSFDKKRSGHDITLEAKRWFSESMFNLSPVAHVETKEGDKPKLTQSQRFVLDWYKEHGESDLSDVPVEPESRYKFNTIKRAAYDLKDMKLLDSRTQPGEGARFAPVVK